MVEKTVSKRGRPVGTRMATVELDTLSFKAPKEFADRVRRYSKEHRCGVSELVRDGLEWRISEQSDPRAWRPGAETVGEPIYEGNTGNTVKVEMGVELLHGMLSALVDEVRQLRNAVQALEQRIEEPGSRHAPMITGNTGITSADGDIPVASMKAQSVSEQAPAGEDTRVSVDVSGRWRERAFTFDPAKHQWGELCHKQHDRDGGQSVREQDNNECVDCRWERSTAYKERKRQAKRKAQLVSG
jgi:hypothetical protein